MCITNNLQRHIRNLTNDGEAVARFLYDTMEGKHPDAKYHHKLEAAKLLERYNPSDDDTPNFWGLIPTPEELAAENNRHSCGSRNPEGQGGDTDNSKLKTVNSLDILNYEIAHLIRQETAEGHTIAQFFSQVMTGRDKPFTPKKLRIRSTDRMASAREIIRRGFGHFGRRRKLVVDDHDDTNDYDTLHTDLARRMREYTEHGTDAVRFLLDVMTDADPDDPYSWHHRVSAALELTRRGWDTNYDNITPEMLQSYWRDQHSTRLSIGHKKHLAGLPTTLDDYDAYDTTDYAALAQELKEQEEENPFVLSLSKSLPPTRSGDGSRNKPETAANMPPLPPGDEPAPAKAGGWSEGRIPAQSPSQNYEATHIRLSRESGNPGPLSPRERVRVRGENNTASLSTKQGSPVQEQDRTSSQSPPSMSVQTDPDLDCYYEPLNPHDQAIFDYELRLESGDLPGSVRPELVEEPAPGSIGGPVEPPSPQAWRDYELALAHLKELAASEGVPLLPNPLSGTLKLPTIRSP